MRFWYKIKKLFADLKDQTVEPMSFGASAIHPAWT